MLTIFLLSKLLSLLPAKILRLLEWVGFSGDKVIIQLSSKVRTLYLVQT